MIRKSGDRFPEKIMLPRKNRHDPEKACPGDRFSEKIMPPQKQRMIAMIAP
jgi:hypothetical protein